MIAVIFLNLPQQENYTLLLLHQLYRESQIGMQHTCIYLRGEKLPFIPAKVGAQLGRVGHTIDRCITGAAANF